jgi:hypothetical protein
MVDEQQLRGLDVEPIADVITYPELVAHPGHHRFGERLPGSRVALHGGEEDALELHKRLLVEDDVIEILCGETACLRQ